MRTALAQMVRAGPVEADTGNPILDAGIVIAVVLILAVGLGVIRARLKRP